MTLKLLIAAFLQSLGIVFLATLPYRLALTRVKSQANRRMVSGIVLTACALGSMTVPVTLVDGLIFDMRHVFLILAATYGGVPAAILMAAATLAYRLFVGGPGVPAGVVGIVLCTLLGIAIAQWSRIGGLTRTQRLVLMGLCASLSLAGLAVTPQETAVIVLSHAGPIFVIANFVGVVLTATMLDHEQARVMREQALAEDASHDALTGLVNRRSFDRRAPEVIAKARAQGRPCSLLLVDIDYFKRVNDTHGHPAGDAVLRAVADILNARSGTSGMAARLGGEEFAILLPGVDEISARRKAERLRTEVAETSHDVGDAKISVTVSIGIDTIIDDGRPFQEAFSRADAALYRAKQTGRNRVTAGRAA
ncbi:GGDEF domain-containing protein [Jiella mangrovi]|uniref:diguanylate cyclase n=1 Tax=Jiella mangrovi TaxID=2821407 RepID=A0ABS4BKP6_9HYPH|nr:diguanylate cyclase [Jiella mangrovi]MBP0617304.1 diguanylate cyclase [Jiella mangrovi]